MEKNIKPRKGKTPKDDGNLAEEVLRQGGKSEEEVQRTGAMDRSDDKLESSFAPEFQTRNSPVHKAVWEDSLPFKLFESQLSDKTEKCHAPMQACLEVVRKHRQAGTLYHPFTLSQEAQLELSRATGDEERNAIVSRHTAANTLYDPKSDKVREEVVEELAKTGYWGMLIDEAFGGQGAPMRSFMPFLTEMASQGDPTTAGMASIHGCIGAVDPVRTYGNDEQKKLLLTRLASGSSISFFALTEPNAGSDLTALRTTFTEDGDDLLVNGEKLFISNAIPGRTGSVAGLIQARDDEGKPVVDQDGKPVMVPAVIELTLPAENEHFQIVHYGLHALKHTYNNGLRFVNFRVPKSALLKIEDGDGLTIAYHGLNRGRDALCANAAGVMRLFLRSITPKSWGEFRKTYGQSIEKRELVQARIARLASLIVGADALVAWCSSILDKGYRGELECVVAKVYGSEAQKEAAIEIAMKTHGGRSFLKGHLIGDNLHDFLAPLIYEGEGQMLSMALFKTLAKQHGMSFMLPLGYGMTKLLKKLPHTLVTALAVAAILGIGSLESGGLLAVGAATLLGGILGWSQMRSFKNLFKSKGVGDLFARLWRNSKIVLGTALSAAMAGWIAVMVGALLGPLGLTATAAVSGLVLGAMADGHYHFIRVGLAYVLWFLNKLMPRSNRKVKGMDRRLQKHMAFAQSMFRKIPLELSTNMIKHQLKLADRQCRINHMSQRVQDTVVIAVTAQYAQKSGDEATVMAADVLCQHLRMKLTGEQPSDKYFKDCRRLAEMIVDGQFHQIDGVPETEVLRKYSA